MKAIVAAAAQTDLAQAVAYYDAQSPGLAHRLIDDFEAAITRIEAFPDAWQPLSENVRRCRLRHFPYGVLYRAGHDSLLIIAVAHLHREPDHWHGR